MNTPGANEAKYSAQVLLNGNRLKREGQENPASFPSQSGVANTPIDQKMDSRTSTRMAGAGGSFAIQLMTNPQLQQTVAQWNGMFGQSNQGMQFNQAKMMMAQAGQGAGGAA